jgi:hypothetical protein
VSGSAWALAGGVLFPQPLKPAREGLIHWVGGDGSDFNPGGTNQTNAWTNLAPVNDDLTSGDPGYNSAPYILPGDVIDGHQLVTFGVAGDANKGLRTGAPNPGAASNLVDRHGAPMDGSSPRTIMTMLRPDWQAAFGRLGGNPWAHSTWQAIFSAWSDAVLGGTAWSHAWSQTDVEWATIDSPLNPYNGQPTLVEWRSDVWPNFQFLVNNVLIATVPTDISLWVPGGVSPLVMAGPGNPSFLGGIAENLYYDWGLTASPHAKNIAYFRGRYPSAPITPDP